MIEKNDLSGFCAQLCDLAKTLGAIDSRVISTTDVVLDERATIKCMVPRCANYAFNLTCPPHNISFPDFKRILGGYNQAVLLRVVNEVIAPEQAGADLVEIWNRGLDSQDNYFKVLSQGQKTLYDIIERLESRCLEAGYYFAAGLSAGGCALCDECVGQTSGKQCRYPFKARPSMEGLGIDVLSTTRRANIDIEFNHQPASWIGLILVD